MGLGKDIFGVGCSATITGVMFLGAPILGVILALLPGDMVDLLTTPEQPAVYWDGAYVLAEEEKDGELDGTETEIVEDPVEDPTSKDETEGTEDDGPGEVDPESKADSVGGEIEGDAVAENGTRAGSSKGEGTTRAPPGVKVTKGATQKESRRKCAESYDGIVLRQDGTYEVDRELVNYYTASIKHFNELGWSKPNDRGDGAGWYVSGFGCNDPLWHGGLRRGDVVLTVNGKKTNNMMQVFLLYSKVKSNKHFEVKVRRRGKHIVLRYDVVKG
ncbi:MAG: hypothetical protein R3F61_32220 [Myxococcota bacterium]